MYLSQTMKRTVSHQCHFAQRLYCTWLWLHSKVTLPCHQQGATKASSQK